MSEARDAYLKVIAAAVAGVVLGAGSWVVTTILDVKEEQRVALSQLEELERRVDFVVEHMLELHPMQRSSLALDLGYFCPLGAECRDDFDCGDCSCVGGYCDAP